MHEVTVCVICAHILSVIFAVGFTVGVYEHCETDNTIFVSNKLWLMLVGSVGFVYSSWVLLCVAFRRHRSAVASLLFATIFVGLGLVAWMIVGLVLIASKHTGCAVDVKTGYTNYGVLFMLPVLVLLITCVFRNDWRLNNSRDYVVLSG